MSATKTHLQPVNPAYLKGLRDHVHAALRQAIVSGKIASGAWLNERQMAEELGVSTTPLKEALRRLEVEGLVATEPRRGVRVTFDAARAEEMGYARAALESMLARLAAERVTPDARGRLKETIAQMTMATRVGHVSELIALNEQFHEEIHAASQCRYLQQLLIGQRVYDSVARGIILNDPDERERALGEHTAIFEAIAANDGERAGRCMREHVMRSTQHHIKTAFEVRKNKSDEQDAD